MDGAVSGSDGALVMAFHGDGERWVGLWPDIDGFRVTGPLTDSGLGGYLGVFFGTLRTPADGAPIVLSDHGMAAAAAAVDGWRSARLLEWLRHAPVRTSFPADGLTQALYAGRRNGDGRWLVALLGDVSAVVREDGEAVFELRTYRTNEGKLPNLDARFRDHTITLFKKHGIASVAYWYQAEPHAKFPALPKPEQLRIKPIQIANPK